MEHRVQGELKRRQGDKETKGAKRIGHSAKRKRAAGRDLVDANCMIVVRPIEDQTQ